MKTRRTNRGGKAVLVTALMLLLALGAELLVSCSNPSTGTPDSTSTAASGADTAAPEESTEVSYDPGISPLNWNDAEFLVLYNGNELEPNLDFKAEALNGSTLNDAVYNRNVKIQEKHKLIIKADYNYDSAIKDTVEKSYKSGEESYHLVEANQTYSMTMAVTGMLQSFDNLPKIDLEKPYWYSGLLSGSILKDKNYFAYSDANVHAFGATPCAIFNKKVAKDFNVDNLYKVVEDGKWTYKYMSDIVKGITGDLDGDQKITKDDRLGMIANNFCVDCFISGSGFQMVSANEEGYPELRVVDEQFYDIVDGVKDLCSVENGMFLVDRTSTATEAREYWTEQAITSDRALFWIGNLKCAERLRSKETDFGILPIPKASEEQENYAVHMQANIGATMAVPASVQNTADVSAIIEDIAYESYLSVMPNYMEVLIQGQVVRDVESLTTLGIIRGSYYCDMGFMLGNYGVSILSTCRDIVTNMGETSIKFKASSKVWDSKLKSFREEMDKLA